MPASVTLSEPVQWLSEGPGPIQGGPDLSGVPLQHDPAVGAVNQVVVDPSNPDHMYAATVNGGVWGTDNGTSLNPHWIPLTDHLPSLSVTRIAFDPLDATHKTLYAALGSNSSDAGDGGPVQGVIKTTDGGNHWSQIAVGDLFAGRIFTALIPTPIMTSSGEVVLASATGGGGIYRSANGGLSWSKLSAFDGLPAADVTSIVADPTNANRYFAGVANHGIYVSTDAGQSWAPDGGLVATIPAAVASAAPEVLLGIGNYKRVGLVLYAAFDSRTASPTVNVYRSTDAGHAWASMGMPPGVGMACFAADPTDPLGVYVGGGPSLVRHGEFGIKGTTVWTQLFLANTNNTYPHADTRSLQFDASANLVETDDGGIYRLIAPNNAVTRHWTSMNGDLRDTEFYSIGWDPVNHLVIGAAQDNGTAVQSAEDSPVWTAVGGGDGPQVAVDATVPGQVTEYISAQNLAGFHRRTVDNHNHQINDQLLALRINGSNIPTIDSNVGFITPFVLNSIDGSRMLIGTHHLYESFNRGDDFVDLGDLGNGVVGLAYGGRFNGINFPDVIYAGANGALFVRTPGGNPIHQVTYPAGTSGPRAIVLDPTNWHIAYVLDFNGHIYRTTTAGQSFSNWTDVTGALNTLFTSDIRTIAFVRSGNTPVLLAGGQGGVYRSVNPTFNGIWSELGDRLPEAPVNDLQYSAQDDVLVAGTLGRGAWILPTASTLAAATNDLTITANDFVDTVRVALDPSNRAVVDIFANGLLVRQSEVGTLQDIIVNANGHAHTLTVDDTNGPIVNNKTGDPVSIVFSSGSGTNSLIVLGDTADELGNGFVVEGSLIEDQALAGGTTRIVASNIQNLDLQGTAAIDIFDFRSTASTLSITAEGGGGADEFNFSDDSERLSRLQGPVTLTANPNSDLTLNDDHDVFGSTFQISTSAITIAGGPLIHYNALRSITLYGGGPSTYKINSLDALTTVAISGGDNNDTYSLADSAHNLTALHGTVIIMGHGGNSSVNFNDQAAAFGHSYSVTNGSLTRDGAGIFWFTNVKTVTLDAGQGADHITLTSTSAGPHMSIFGDGGNDSIFGGSGDDDLDGGAGNDLIHGGAGNDRITGGAGIDSLFGDNGNDSLFARDGLADNLDGGAGIDSAMVDSHDHLTSIEVLIA